jgi:hypothetical protein
MKNPTPDPVGHHADQMMPQIEDAIAKGDVNEIVNLAMRAIYLTAIAICEDAGVPIRLPSGQSQLRKYRALRDACDAHLEENDDERVAIACEAFVAIAVAESTLRSRSPTSDKKAGDDARILLAGAQLGQVDAMLGMVRTGQLQQYGEAVFRLQKIGAHLRGRVPTWEEAFMPAAASFCEGKEKVTLGALVAEARRWAAALIVAGRGPGLPSTDDGIKAGLKRMELRGLSIPGRKSN